MNLRESAVVAALGTLLVGCVSIPTGPSVSVLPGPGKPFDLFQTENTACRDYAKQQVGVNPDEVARNQVLTGAGAGALIGAATGALLSHGRNGPTQFMAGEGLLIGGAMGANAANQTGMTLQHRYDIAYEQCMYARGNQVPGYAPQQYSLPPPPPPPPR